MIVSICLISFIMKHFRSILLVIFFFPSWEGISQTEQDSVHYLAEVLIKSSRLQNFTSTHKFTSLDSMTIHGSGGNNLADLLSHHTPIFVKSYGLGGLATTSFRGTGASHTAVLWNGFTLQSPAHGQTDLALIPTFLLNQVEIQHGGSSALFGSGALGGVIHLNNPQSFDKGISLSMKHQYGSYGQFFQGYQAGFSKQKFSSSIKVFHQFAENDFNYINDTQFGNPKVKQTNAKLFQYGVMQDNFWRITPAQQLNFRLWYQFSDREIPPTAVEAASQASQQDRSWRFSSEWSKRTVKWQLAVRTAFFNENLVFIDPAISLESESLTRSSISELESEINLNDHLAWNIGLNNTYSYGRADNYSGSRSQNRIAAFSSLSWKSADQKLTSILSLRQELSDSETAPLVPSLGINYYAVKYLLVQGNVSRTYRLPTFNDLYWTGAGARGNSGLQSESGWSQEITVSLLHSQIGNLAVEGSVTGFNSNVSNWILWSPDSTSIWSPQNLITVHARGMESTLQTAWHWGESNLRLKAGYSYVASTNEKVKTGNEQTLHKQLIYVPKHQANGHFFFILRGFEISYTHTFTGSRFTTTDNRSSLPSYQTGKIKLAKNFQWRMIRAHLHAQVDNLWDEKYQVIAFRPMPGRNYQIGLTIEFTKPNVKP